MYNLMTGQGFEGGAYSSPWFMGWVGLAILAVLIMLSKKWLDEEQALGYEYKFFGGFLGVLVYFLIIVFTGQAKWAMLGGVIGMFGGGLGVGKYLSG